MRDPKRIPKILAEVQKMWELLPDMRLSQLLYNSTETPSPTFYYMEDEALIECLKLLYGIDQSGPVLKRCTRAIELFFDGNDEKVDLWFSTENPLLGGISPLDMISAGREEKLWNIITTCIEENKLEK